MQKDTLSKLSTTTIVLHWIVAFAIIMLMGVGMYMEETEALVLYPIHKSIGMIVFLVILYRVIWRISNGWPEPVSDYKQIEKMLASLVHWVLIIGMLLFPISGVMMSHAGGYGLAIFGLELTPMNIDPADATKVIANNKFVAEFAHNIHHLLGEVMIVAIVLHIAGALKHHIYDMDKTLKRMMGKKT